MHRKGWTSGETASPAPSADKGLDKASWEPLVSLWNRWVSRGKMGREPGLPPRPQVAYTKLDPQINQQGKKPMGTLFCSFEKAAPYRVPPFLTAGVYKINVCGPREG